MATVVIPSLLRKFTGGAERVAADGATLRELIRTLNARFPELTGDLVENNEIRPSIAVSVDGEIATSGMLEPVRPDSEVHFIPALGGG
ncbi:MAG TPA: MoaD/ThiS family protein [Candidatus Binataceae bacterium]|nr:MoaD/ThiS family protein [Candidatus Binataceae bacterium]